MRGEWLPLTVLRTASLLAPGERRAEWLREWRSELWYVPRREAARFCLGAFRDALWVRRNELRMPPGGTSRLETPASCLGFVAALAAVSIAVVLCLLTPLRLRTTFWRLRPRDLPVACLAMLGYTAIFLPVTCLVMGRPATEHYPGPWRSRLRRGLFLALKIALVQPILLCGLLLEVLLAPLVPALAPPGMVAMWILTFRWVILDQQRRCPVCLRALTNPVRIGTPSQSFLDWYGAESMCSRGHGLLQVPEIAASYSGAPQWHGLDASWSGLFSRAGARQ